MIVAFKYESFHSLNASYDLFRDKLKVLACPHQRRNGERTRRYAYLGLCANLNALTLIRDTEKQPVSP
jgi:hypothetical protein